MKHKSLLFVALCLTLCLIPSVGMLFFPTTQTTENKAMAAAPVLVTEEGKLNRDFFGDFEYYFNQHMALRNPLVYADAKVQTALFQESNVSGVIYGTDGWLYYASTLDDYLGRNLLSEQQLSNLANNFAVVQAYLQQQDIDFLLTIPPNKNTLYGENMPYHSDYVVNTDLSAELLAPYLQRQDVSYLDLFQLFGKQKEILYLRQDSHWNQKGACMVYNHIMDGLSLAHEDYSHVQPAMVENADGDLNKMLYSFYGKPETDYDYSLSQDYAYEKNGATVEDGWIVTHNSEAAGTLLMFRDSFANTLIPFFSNAFGTACYSKGQPNALERFVETYRPDCVVIEKVERNITDYLDNPPILTAPMAERPNNITISKTDTTLVAESALNDANYYKFSGTVDAQRLQTDARILLQVDGTVYRCYQTGEDGYLCYLKKEAFSGTAASVQVYIATEDSCVQALSAKLDLP